MEKFLFDKLGYLVIIFGALMIWLIVSISEQNCKVLSEDLQMNYKWSFVAGCRVEIDGGRFVKIESYRLTEIK